MAARVKGWWYPWIYVGLLGFVIGVNLLMAYFATSTFNGISTENAYEKGLTYNSVIAMAQKQQDLGWTANLVVEPTGAGHAVHVSATYQDKDGKALESLDVRALISRPTVAGSDQKLVLEPKGKGIYAADVDLAMGGQWDVDVAATSPEGLHQVQKRILIP